MTSVCTGYVNQNEKWIHNEAHGGLFGVYLNKDGLPGCTLIQNFFVWRSYDYGIYSQVSILNYFCFSSNKSVTAKKTNRSCRIKII